MKDLFTLNSLLFFAIGAAGMIAHAVKKWQAGEIEGRLLDWYLVNPRATVGAVLLWVGGVGYLLLDGTLTDPNVKVQFLAAFFAGYGGDTFNKQGPR